jgi:putative CocE/NonD family hydrolase
MSSHPARALCGVLFLVLVGLGRGAGQEAYDVKAHYEKHEVMIPMRDGVKLFTIVYAPRARSERYPILLTRTAYGIAPYGLENYRAVVGPNNEFAREGYIVVYQDIRGKFRSEGEFVHHRPYVKGSAGTNESTDTYDTIAWLLKNVPNHNGRVGQWGISWAGWQVSMGMIDAHPAIQASSPQAPPQDQFQGDDYHSGGAFQLMYGFNWMSANARARSGPNETDARRFVFPTPDGYRFFLQMGAAANASRYFDERVPTWDDFMSHGTYDEYWQARNVPKDLVNVSHPVLIVAGWFDAEDFHGPFRMYRGLQAHNPGNKATLVVGPWSHGGWSRSDGESLGAIDFGSKTGVHFRSQIELPFFNRHLKGKGAVDLPKAMAFETGANRWHSLSGWPPPGAVLRRLYLHPDGKLAFSPPAARSEDEFDSFVSDPSKPVPYTAEVRTSEGQLFTVEDQRFVAGRPDVLVYESEVLPEDVTIAGPIVARLRVATSGTDADYVVKLIDVFPDNAPNPDPNPRGIQMGGYQMLVVGDILRAKFRNSLSRPEAMTPDRPTDLGVELGDRYHTFQRGHRIMVQVQSSWFPMFDRNPQRFVDIYHAKDSDYQAATQKIYRGGERGSHVEIQVLGQERVTSRP